ncbi:two-component system sensor histidine kinase NtrB [Salipaludibacillus keqinensis]|nr:ATP-binding protein [Salipaludibacillus keqinensis]
MKKVNEWPIYLEMIYLSSDFCMVLNEDLEIEEVITEDQQLRMALEHPFQSFAPNPAFENFIYSIVKNSISTTKQIFTIEKHNSYQCKGKKVEDKIVILGKKCASVIQKRDGILDNLPIPAMLIDIDGKIVKFNSHLQNLHSRLDIPENLLDPLVTSQWSHPVFKEYFHVFQQLLESKQTVTREYRTEEVRLKLQGVVDGNHYVIMMKDESFQRRFEQLLSYQQQMQAVSQIAAGVAHELRNPLSVIKGFVQLSKYSNNLDKYYDTIYSEIDRMNKIIEDFLSISRKKIDKRYIHPAELVESMLVIFRSECILHDVEFIYKLGNCEGYLYVNEQMLKQVLINIMRNSIEAYEGQKRNRTFNLQTFIEDGFYVIQLKDNGPGIAPELFEKINEPFFTTKEKGTGIGIPLARQIIEEHKGKFIIDSTYGKGTLISIQLPLENKPPL